MAEGITRAAAELASVLEGLPDVKKAYPFPKSGGLQLGDLCLAISQLGVAQTFGEQTTQEVVWDCLIRLGSAASRGRPADTQTTIARLGSSDPVESIDGILRSEAVSDRLRPYGSPRLTEDGLEITYGTDEEDGALVTLLQCSIMATVRNT